MMSTLEIQEHLDKIKFLNYRFRVLHELSYGPLRIGIIYEAPDSANRKKFVPVKCDWSIPMPKSKEQLTEIIFDMVRKSLFHEAGELFFVDGKLPFNEHSEDEMKFINEMMNA